MYKTQSASVELETLKKKVESFFVVFLIVLRKKKFIVTLNKKSLSVDNIY